MSSDRTSIKTILCIPHTPTLWLYYINDGERHAANDEQLMKLLTSLTPSLISNVTEKMSKHIPFFIDVEKTTFQEAGPDIEAERMKLKQDLRKYQQKELYKVLYLNANESLPLYTTEKESLFDRVLNLIKKEKKDV